MEVTSLFFNAKYLDADPLPTPTSKIVLNFKLSVALIISKLPSITNSIDNSSNPLIFIIYFSLYIKAIFLKENQSLHLHHKDFLSFVYPK